MRVVFILAVIIFGTVLRGEAQEIVVINPAVHCLGFEVKLRDEFSGTELARVKCGTYKRIHVTPGFYALTEHRKEQVLGAKLKEGEVLNLRLTQVGNYFFLQRITSDDVEAQIKVSKLREDTD